MTTSPFPTWAAVLLAAAATAAHAGRPLATEDADVLDAGSCELEGFASRLDERLPPASRGTTLQFGCGIGWDTQAALGWTHARSGDESAHAWALGGKTAIVRRGQGGVGLTLAWGFAAERPPGGPLKHEATALNLVATREWSGGWLTHANLGWLRSESASASTTTWNLALERPVGGGVDLMAELYGDDRTRPWVGVGARWAASERLGLNASYAVQDESPRPRLWTVGFKLVF